MSKKFNYAAQFVRTDRNKARRAAARLKKAQSPATAMRRLRRAQREEDRRLAKIEAARVRKEAQTNTATRAPELAPATT